MTLRTSITWIDTLIALAFAAAVGVLGGPASGLIAGLMALMVIGVWRIVRFIGVLVQLKQAEHEDHEGDAFEASAFTVPEQRPGQWH